MKRVYQNKGLNKESEPNGGSKGGELFQKRVCPRSVSSPENQGRRSPGDGLGKGSTRILYQGPGHPLDTKSGEAGELIRLLTGSCKAGRR